MTDLQRLEDTQKACKKLRDGLEAWFGKPSSKKGKQENPLSELAATEQKAADLFSDPSLKSTLTALSDATSKLATENISLVSEANAKVLSVLDAFLDSTYPTLSKELKALDLAKADYEKAQKNCEKITKVDKKERAEAEVKAKKQNYDAQSARVSSLIKQLDDAYPHIENAIKELISLMAMEYQKSANIMTELSTKLKVGQGPKKSTS